MKPGLAALLLLAACGAGPAVSRQGGSAPAGAADQRPALRPGVRDAGAAMANLRAGQTADYRIEAGGVDAVGTLRLEVAEVTDREITLRFWLLDIPEDENGADGRIWPDGRQSSLLREEVFDHEGHRLRTHQPEGDFNRLFSPHDCRFEDLGCVTQAEFRDSGMLDAQATIDPKWRFAEGVWHGFWEDVDFRGNMNPDPETGGLFIPFMAEAVSFSEDGFPLDYAEKTRTYELVMRREGP
ncbi:hypothetical protein [Oceanicella sp. SM1341]|uniref:hypothetical protein n=1 Tax=Oceanicella sp. SM1341 TaxID=1548889 RepID=UPI000E4E56E8|nr:hypothetical protein [Oceanicella sp. SM1341]